MSNFIKDCLEGDADLTDINDYIDRWHDGPDDGVTLIDFLGMTKKEYEIFLLGAENLPFIIRAHRTRSPIQNVMKAEYNMAARSTNVLKNKQIMSWLEKEGL